MHAAKLPWLSPEDQLTPDAELQEADRWHRGPLGDELSAGGGSCKWEGQPNQESRTAALQRRWEGEGWGVKRWDARPDDILTVGSWQGSQRGSERVALHDQSRSRLAFEAFHL